MSHSVALSTYMTPRHQAALFLLGAVILWGFTPVGNRYFLGTGDLDMPGAAYMALRFSIPSIFFLPVVLVALRTWSLGDWALGSFCGLAGVTGYNLLAALAARTVSAGMAGLINSSESLMILILGCLVIRRFPDRRTLFAAFMGLVGVFVLAASAGPAEGNVSGIVMLLIGALGWAIYCVFIPPLIAKHGVLQSSGVTMFIGMVPLLVLGWHGLGPMVHKMTRTDWEVLLFVSLGSSVFAMLAWNKGMARLGAQTSGWFLYLMPVFSALGGRLLLKEPLTIYELIGGALVLGSVYIAQRR